MPFRSFKQRQNFYRKLYQLGLAGAGGIASQIGYRHAAKGLNRMYSVRRAAYKRARGKTRTGKRRRKYGGTSSAAPQVMPSLSFNHGKQIKKLSNSQIKAIRNALVPANNYNKTSTKQMDLTSNGQCLWGAVTLYHADDVEALMNSVSAEPSTRVQASGASLQCFVANATNQNCFVDVYDVVNRRDVPGVEQGIEYIINNGFVDSEQKTDDVGNTDLVATPYKNPRFTSFYKIIGQRKYQMPPGGQMRLNLTDKSDHFFVDGMTNSKDEIKGLTRHLLIKLTGSVVSDATTETAISTGTARLNFIVKTQYTYKWIEDNDISSYQSTSLGTITTEHAINPLTGAEEAANEA